MRFTKTPNTFFLPHAQDYSCDVNDVKSSAVFPHHCMELVQNHARIHRLWASYICTGDPALLLITDGTSGN